MWEWHTITLQSRIVLADTPGDLSEQHVTCCLESRKPKQPNGSLNEVVRQAVFLLGATPDEMTMISRVRGTVFTSSRHTSRGISSHNQSWGETVSEFSPPVSLGIRSKDNTLRWSGPLDGILLVVKTQTGSGIKSERPPIVFRWHHPPLPSRLPEVPDIDKVGWIGCTELLVLLDQTLCLSCIPRIKKAQCSPLLFMLDFKYNWVYVHGSQHFLTTSSEKLFLVVLGIS